MIRARRRRSGFTLLEVLLALAILVGSLATIGALAERGLRHASRAAAISKAQLYCESKLAELTAGIILPAPASAAPLEVDPNWTYSIDVTPDGADPALLAVRVTVSENVAPPMLPVEFSLTRWMMDPVAAADEAASTSSTSADSSSSTTTSSTSAAGGS